MRRTAFVVASTVLSLVLFAPMGSAKNSGCKKIRGNWDLTFNFALFQWEGPAWGVLGDQVFTADLTFVPGPAKDTDDGNIVGTETGTFDFGAGDTFTEVDKFTFGPSDDDPELWHFNGVGRITEGTGKFQDAFGKLVLQGTADFPEASGTVKGRVCDIAGEWPG